MVSNRHLVIILATIFFTILTTTTRMVDGGRSGGGGRSKIGPGKRQNETNVDNAPPPPPPRGQVVFIGASITQWWLTEGFPVWSKYYAPLGAVNVGVAGDGTQQTIDRINFGYIDHLAPVAKVAVLNIGNNDLSIGLSVEHVHGQIGKILTLLNSKLPQAKVILLQILPRCCTDVHTKARSVNTLIRNYEDGQKVFFLDMEDKFCSGLGKVYPELYQFDQIHLKVAGYQVWADAMESLLSKLINSSDN